LGGFKGCDPLLASRFMLCSSYFFILGHFVLFSYSSSACYWV
jgi:hypothetical protein